MILLVGESTLHFHSKTISASLMQRFMSEKLIHFNVSSHHINDYKHKLSIKFIMELPNQNYNRLDDYSELAYPAFNRIFPIVVDVEPFNIIKIAKHNKPPKFNRYMVSYIDNISNK